MSRDHERHQLHQAEQLRPPAGPVPDGATSLPSLIRMRTGWRQYGATMVWTNGCFDILHPGHVRFLDKARDLGDVLIVGINDDASVRRLKGPERPFIQLAGRVTLLVGLQSVDRVVILSGDAPTPEIEALRPDVCCKDSDYAHLPLPEREVVEGYGGRMVLLPRDATWSTTSLVARAAAQACRGACS